MKNRARFPVSQAAGTSTVFLHYPSSRWTRLAFERMIGVELRGAGQFLEQQAHNMVVVNAHVTGVEFNVVKTGQGRDLHHFAGGRLRQRAGTLRVQGR